MAFKIIAALLLAALNSYGATYYLSPTGDNANDGTATNAAWSTLRKAAQTLQAGDTLFVMGGLYDSAVTYQYFGLGLYDGIGVYGTDESPIVLTNYPGETPLFINGNLSTIQASIINIGKTAWVKLYGLSFSNCFKPITLTDNSTNCEIAYCTIGPSATVKRGSLLGFGDNCRSNYIHHNTIFNCWSSEQTNTTWIQGESGDVVSFGTSWQSETNRCNYNIFATNVIYGGGHSVFNPGGSDNHALGNVMLNPPWILWTNAHIYAAHRVVGSWQHRCVYDGNILSFSGQPVANDGSEGIGLFGSGNIVRRNIIAWNQNYGMELYDKGQAWRLDTNRVYNNTFAHNATGLEFYTNYTTGVIYSNTTTRCMIMLAGGTNCTNNIFKNNIFAFNGGSTTNQVQSRGTYGTDTNSVRLYTNYYNNVSGDPMFIADTNESPCDITNQCVDVLGLTNSAWFDYRLQSSSPAINIGDYLTTVNESGEGTNVTVSDATYFWEGLTVSGTAFPGDTIQLQGATNTAIITAIDRTNNTLTLDTALTFTKGQGVFLAYIGSAPDMGAYEFSGLIPPTLTLSPANAATLASGSNTFTATASGCSGMVTNIVLYLNGDPISTNASNTLSFSTNLVSGDYTNWAYAETDDGTNAYSATNVFYVRDPISALAISAPANGSVHAPGAVTMSVSATLGDGALASVRYYIGGSLIGTVTNTPWSLSYNPGPGVKSLTATATDENGFEASASAVTFTVQNPSVSTNAQRFHYWMWR